jgi:hypothetical protein
VAWLEVAWHGLSWRGRREEDLETKDEPRPAYSLHRRGMAGGTNSRASSAPAFVRNPNPFRAQGFAGRALTEMNMTISDLNIGCPFVYANGRRCIGHVTDFRF